MTDETKLPVHQEVFEAGMKNRRAVLGDAYVDRAWQRAQEDPFLQPLQDAVTGLAWGAIWGRPGLGLKTRSIITVSMLIALNRRHELALHMRGALNIGWTREELREVIMHASCYCGMPAAVDGFRLIKEVLEELDAE